MAMHCRRLLWMMREGTFLNSPLVLLNMVRKAPSVYIVYGPYREDVTRQMRFS